MSRSNEASKIKKRKRREAARQPWPPGHRKWENFEPRSGRWCKVGDDPQKRGYGLEDLLAELFEVHEIAYRRPYRTATEQIDGHFEFRGFDYLVEARWRVEPPSEADLAAFKIKVDKKLTSTRGLFVSIVGFRPEVVMEFTRGVTSNIVLMDSADLSLILEGHISLVDALDAKINKAAQEGIIYFPLAQRFMR